MSRSRRSLVVTTVAMLIALAGCGKAAQKPPPKVEDTVFGDTVAAKEKVAKDVEKAMEQHKQDLEEAVKKSEEVAPP